MTFAAITIKVGLGGLLLLPFWIAAIGWLSGRVLGIRIGRWRSAARASIGWLLGAAATAAALVSGATTDRPDWIVIVLVIFFGVLAALPVAIVLDLVHAATGPAAPRPLAHPIQRGPGGDRAHRSLSPAGRQRPQGEPRQSALPVRGRADTPDFARRLRRARATRAGCS